MLKSLFQKLAVVTVGTAMSLVATQARPLQAATVTYNFTIDNLSGPLSGNLGAGSFSYDNSTLKGSGNEAIFLKDNFKLNFDFLGRTYTEANDLGSDNPSDQIVSFSNGQLVGLFYAVFPAPAPLNVFGIGQVYSLSESSFILQGGGNEFGYLTADGQVGEGDVTYTLVTPATTPTAIPAATFTTTSQAPPTSVPEPEDIGSFVLAGSMTLLLKKKLASSKE